MTVLIDYKPHENVLSPLFETTTFSVTKQHKARHYSPVLYMRVH